MALQSPRKVVPLAIDDEHVPRPKPRSANSNFTRRVFFCGVVVEGTEGGRELPQDVKDLIASLGESMDLLPSSTQATPSLDGSAMTRAASRRRAMTNTSALADITKELLTTERSYVKKLRILKTEYADPLRNFSKNKNTAILGTYEAKAIFGNVDQLLPVNEAFLADLERMEENGLGVGDVALKHFRDLQGFETYKTYFSKHEEVQKLFEHEVKKNSRFSEFIERVKYSTAADSRNRFGLREILAEPWQRIPRYTLMFNTMLKHMAMNHPQRKPLEEAIVYASDIAKAETDEETKRMAIMHALSTSVDDFPYQLISNSRHLIDCIDVQDIIPPDPYSPISSSGSGNSNTLHCTLFLFNDKLMIVKRPSEKSGRSAAGLDQLDKIAKGSILPASMRKSGLVCKGVVDITDVVATDVGGADMHLFLESALSDQSERWGGRQFRALSVVFPPAPVYLDPTRTEKEKQRFLGNLWATQARFRTRSERSIVLRGEEFEVENRGGYVTAARTYFNVYTRMAFMQEPKKTKIVMHIDHEGVADAIPFGDRDGPYVVVRVQPMAGELARYNVTSSYEDEPEEDIMQTTRIPERIVQTIHQYGLFKFKTNAVSRPTTPTASRSRAAIFGLDVISRNLFGARPGSAMGDFFGGSINGHRRSRTNDSRSSTLTSSTAGSSMTGWSHSSSTTAATSLDDGSRPSSISNNSRNSRARSLSRAKKLVKRAKSPFMNDRGDETGSDDDDLQPSSSLPNSNSHMKQVYQRARSLSSTAMTVDDSERDLAKRLELARRNSQNQNGNEYDSAAIQEQMEDTIYEDEPPPSLRTQSRLSRNSRSLPDPEDYDYDEQSVARTITPTYRALSMSPGSPDGDARPGSRSSFLSESQMRPLSRNSNLSESQTRPLSRNSMISDRHPMGPRSPSPLPPASPNIGPHHLPTLDTDMELTLVNTPFPVTPTRTSNPKTPIPRSKRQPFEPSSFLNSDVTPRASTSTESASAESARPPSIVEPLSFKKRPSVRTNPSASSLSASGSSVPGPRKNSLVRRPSPIGKGAFSSARTRRVSAQRAIKPLKLEDEVDLDAFEERIKHALDVTKADIESSHRVVRRMKLETQKLTSSSPVRAAVATWETRPGSPVKRLPQRPTSPAMTREAMARREEMLQAIGKRIGEGSSGSGGERGGATKTRPRVHTMFEATTSSSSLLSNSTSRNSQSDDLAPTIDGLVDEAEQALEQAARSHENVVSDIKHLMQLLRERTDELVKTGQGAHSWKRQYEAVSELLQNSQAEVNELYQYFNDELDAMYDVAHLPDDDAWAAMTRKVRDAQQAKARVEQENSQLKTRIAELSLQQEHWATILREHGLLP